MSSLTNGLPDDIRMNITRCKQLQSYLASKFEELKGATNPNYRSKTIIEIQKTLDAYKSSLYIIRSEIDEIDENDDYKYSTGALRDAENTFKMLSRSWDEYSNLLSDAQRSANNVQRSDNELMNDITSMQKGQTQSLGRTIQNLKNAHNAADMTLEEQKRQQEALLKVGEDLDEMVSELERAKKYLRAMLTRAAGDVCVRVLAIIVLIAVIGVIIVEIVKPGSVASAIESGFKSETNSSKTL